MARPPSARWRRGEIAKDVIRGRRGVWLGRGEAACVVGGKGLYSNMAAPTLQMCVRGTGSGQQQRTRGTGRSSLVLASRKKFLFLFFINQFCI